MREIDALRDFHRKDKKEYRVFIESQNLWRFDGILEIITIFAVWCYHNQELNELSPSLRSGGDFHIRHIIGTYLIINPHTVTCTGVFVLGRRIELLLQD